VDVLERVVLQDETLKQVVTEVGNFTNEDDHGKRFGVVTGNASVLSELAAIMASGDFVGEAPQMLVFARDQYFSFLRSDVTTIAPYLERWYVKNIAEAGSS
jgi:hypothetical protein